MKSDVLPFLAEFVRHPLTVGAIAPSSAALAERVAAPVSRTGAPVVIELGPGTGAFTSRINRRLAPGGQHVAVEINPRFADRLVRRYPEVDVRQADAAALAELNLPPADAVISGLPWAVFTPDRQDAILDAIRDVLADGGAFTTFTYVHAAWTPPARRLRAALRARFEEVVPSRTVWSNLPPAFVYHARRPIRATAEQMPFTGARVA